MFYSRLFVLASAKARTSMSMSMSITILLCLGVFLSTIGWVVVVNATAVADTDNNTTPVSAPDTPIEYPVRVLGSKSHKRLPDDARCRWLPSGPDVWMANNESETCAKDNQESNQDCANKNTNTNTNTNTTNSRTLDVMFRRIVTRYQKDDTLRGRLTIASSPDALPQKVKSDYVLNDDNDNNDDDGDDNDNSRKDDDPLAMYLHEGDGGPWILVIDDFLDEEEATQLVELGREECYTKSTIMDDNESNDDIDDVVDEEIDGDIAGDGDGDDRARTSSSVWYMSSSCNNVKIYQNVINRIYELVGMEDNYSERPRFLQYGFGEYHMGHRGFSALPNATERSQDGGRILTVFLYLNDVESGGETEFPRLNLTVTPKVGRLVLWPSVLNQNPSKADYRTEHSALEVTKGIKYGINLWFHLKPFRKKWFNYECDAPVANGRVIWLDDYDAYSDDDDYYDDFDNEDDDYIVDDEDEDEDDEYYDDFDDEDEDEDDEYYDDFDDEEDDDDDVIIDGGDDDDDDDDDDEEDFIEE